MPTCLQLYIDIAGRDPEIQDLVGAGNTNEDLYHINTLIYLWSSFGNMKMKEILELPAMLPGLQIT